jgi:hypothetical protein
MLRGMVNSICSTPPPPFDLYTPLLAKGVYLFQPHPLPLYTQLYAGMDLLRGGGGVHPLALARACYFSWL